MSRRGLFRVGASYGGARIQAVDVLRGLAIVLMALDHVRDYFHESGSAYDPLDFRFTTPALYFTRWITHFCAPTFIFLAGVSAWLQRAKKDTRTLSWFLLTRGLWIVFLEATVISFAWSFSIPLLIYLAVMWAIGLSMVALSALVWLPRPALLSIGIAILTLHNLMDRVPVQRLGHLAQLLHERGLISWNGKAIAYAEYPVLPWVGMMALGYGLGFVFLSPHRNRFLMALGSVLVAAFLVLRVINKYGDPRPWSTQADLIKTLMDFMNGEKYQKYPPSLMYVCVTLGPVLLLIPFLDRLKHPVAEFLQTLGAVPLMAYISHLYIVHALSLITHFAAGRNYAGLINTIHNAFFEPGALKGLGFPLWVNYVAWLIVIALVYPICRWWRGVKQRRHDWWLSYL
jgi:uncharacterized membrane protein